MPDEHSNLNSPAAVRRPVGRRRGRRGGRGRTPRPAAGKSTGAVEEIPSALAVQPENVVETDHPEFGEPEADTSGDFREPHPEEHPDEHSESAAPQEISQASAAVTAPVAEIPPAAELEPARRPERPARPEQRRSDPPHSKPWVKPADFRPAETSAISQAVTHATEIAESLKHTIDQLDEILELVEVAERQKLADEREIDDLRRALRRIQPPRQLQQSPPRNNLRRDEPRRDYREQSPRRDEPPAPREPEPSRENPNPEE